MPVSYSWTTDFATPDPVPSLAITSDLDSIALVASWGDGYNDYHYEYLVEAQVGDGAWTEIGRTDDLSFTWYFAPLNREVRIRVSDSNGALYSEPTEETGTLEYPLWTLAHLDGDDAFIGPFAYAQEGARVELPLDQVVIQPASGPEGDESLPIVFTGQWQGERISISVLVQDDDDRMLDALRGAALEPAGKIAIKSPYGKVWTVAIGGQSLVYQDGFAVAQIAAIRIA